MAADHMAWVEPSVIRELVKRGCAHVDRNSTVAYVYALPDPLAMTDEMVQRAYGVMAGWPCFTYEDGLAGMRAAFAAAFDDTTPANAAASAPEHQGGER